MLRATSTLCAMLLCSLTPWNNGLAQVVSTQAATPAIVQTNPTLIQEGTWIVTLGARLNPDCTMPNVLTERLDKTVQVASANMWVPILVTGGFTQKGCNSEAEAMRTYLIEHGVKSQRITIDETAYTTVGNAQAADKIVPAGGVIVTSPEHLPRALETFNQYAPHRQWVGVSSGS